MRDPRFAKTVILMIQHDQHGAMGLVVNKPVGEGPLAKLMEGFGAPYTIGGSSSIDTSTWVSPDLSNVESPASQDILNRPEQPVPLPEGRMSFFGSTKFSPECCPNAYSTSSGCACMTMNQYNSLRNRGGNTDSLSEF
jgi:hypothetical protein